MLRREVVERKQQGLAKRNTTQNKLRRRSQREVSRSRSRQRQLG